MSRIIVTGATGFLGLHLCLWLKKAGHEVIGIGRNQLRGDWLKERRIGFETADLTRPETFPSLGRADGLVHAAALSSAWGRKAAFQAHNVAATRHVLDWAERLEVSRFVHISTPSLYFRFVDQLDLTEDAPLPKPVNAYAATKAEAEDWVRARKDMCAIILRPRGLYGPGDKAILPRLMRVAKRGPLPLLRDGVAITDLTHVEDACLAIERALNAPFTASGRTYNISGGVARALTGIITQAGQLAGLKVRFKPMPLPVAMTAARLAEAVSWCLPGAPEPVITAYGMGILAYSQTLNIEAARRDLTYVPKIGFDEGLKRTFAEAGKFPA